MLVVFSAYLNLQSLNCGFAQFENRFGWRLLIFVESVRETALLLAAQMLVGEVAIKRRQRHS